MSTSDSTGPEGATFDPWGLVLGLFGLGNLANGIWMLVDPVHWFHTLPAGVPDFGPLNEHFIRDIGCIFTLLGSGLVASAFVPSLRVVACGAAAGFSVLHALVHVLDTARGLVGPEHWGMDAPLVYGPAVILCGLTLWLARASR
ncbi:MAG: hypothetical protein CL910_14380 [Deltaproteobacteria bacterium]|jgi:hypothetical protein|nr:hypothetical protein [Deltaproteobacteria bacterium]